MLIIPHLLKFWRGTKGGTGAQRPWACWKMLVLGSRRGPCEPPVSRLPLPCLAQWILQLVTNRSQSRVGVSGPVLLLGEWGWGGGWDYSSPCGFINLRAAIFKGLKDALSLKTPALDNGGLFPSWGRDLIWRKCLWSGRTEAPSWSGSPARARGQCPPKTAVGGHMASPVPVAPPGQVWRLLQQRLTGALLGAPSPGRYD